MKHQAFRGDARINSNRSANTSIALGQGQLRLAKIVFKITPTGQISVFRSGLTTILGLAFDSAGRLYVLENTTGNSEPTPGTGKVVRIDPSGSRTVIASGLFLPTAMTFGPDGALYVSNVGFGPPPNGLGQVLKITVP